MEGIIVCYKGHPGIAYTGDVLVKHGKDCSLCQAIDTAMRFKKEKEEIKDKLKDCIPILADPQDITGIEYNNCITKLNNLATP
jgi:hypothetical protein